MKKKTEHKESCPHLEECRESLRVLFWKDGTGTDGYDCRDCDAGQKFRKVK